MQARTMEDRDGVGEKRLQLTTTQSMDLGLMPVALNTFSTAPQMTILASCRAFCRERSILSAITAANPRGCTCHASGQARHMTPSTRAG